MTYHLSVPQGSESTRTIAYTLPYYTVELLWWGHPLQQEMCPDYRGVHIQGEVFTNHQDIQVSALSRCTLFRIVHKIGFHCIATCTAYVRWLSIIPLSAWQLLTHVSPLLQDSPLASVYSMCVWHLSQWVVTLTSLSSLLLTIITVIISSEQNLILLLF